MANKIQLRRDTLANWIAVNPVLGDGEPGFVIDTNQIKYGDGSTPWNDLGWGGTGLNPLSVAIGIGAGKTNQSNYSVAVGIDSGYINQSEWAIAIGPLAGRDTQGNEAVAVGDEAGYYHQGFGAVAIGGYGEWGGGAGSNSQGHEAVAIGASAGNNNQGAFAIAIGSGAGYSYQTTGSIAIFAGPDAGNYSINNAGFYVAPIRNDLTSTNLALFYDATTKEITSGYPNTLANGAHSITLASDGALTGDGANGNFYIDTVTSTGTTSTWVFGVNGNLTAPGTINVGTTGTSSAVNIQGVGAGDVVGYPTLLSMVSDDGNPWAITVQNATAGLGKGLGVYVENTGNIVFETLDNTSSFRFITGSNPWNHWTFDADGGLTFPDATVQTTAYTGQGGATTNAVSVLDDNLSGVITYDASTGTTWIHAYPTSNFTANFVNLPVVNNSIIECKIIITQGSTTGIPNMIQIEGSPGTINWTGGTPEGYTQNTDEITFKLIRTYDTWFTPLGSLTTYGSLPPRVNTTGPLGRFLVMGQNNFYTSIDGVSWSQCNSNGTQQGNQNVTADLSTGRIWTAGDASGYSGSDTVYYTTDLFGSAWAESGTLPSAERWDGIVAHGDNVVVWHNSFPATVYASTDTGVTWNLAVTNSGTFYQPQMAWNSVTSQFIAVGSNASFTSTDGVSWIKNGDIGAGGYSGQIASGGGKLVAAGWSGVVYSLDHGATWNDATNTNPWGDLRGVAYGNGMWVAAAYDMSLTYGITSSADGITWTNQPIFTNSPLWDLEFGNGTFIARGVWGGTYVSTTGLEGSWTTATHIGSYGEKLIFVPNWA
jgi:hypothetical protein